MKTRLATPRIAVFLCACAGVFAAAPALGADSLVEVRMSVDEDPIVPRLAESLGYLRRAS